MKIRFLDNFPVCSAYIEGISMDRVTGFRLWSKSFKDREYLRKLS
jgi:hypothetical protein